MAAKRRDERRPRQLVTSTVKPDESVADKADESSAESPTEPTGAQSGAQSDTQATPQENTASEPVPVDEGGKTFGAGQRAWAIVEVSDDAQQVTLTAMALNGLTPSATELARELAHCFGLQGHFDGKALRGLIQQAAADVFRGTVVIAHGTPAEAGEDGTVQSISLKGHDDKVADALRSDFATALAAATVQEAMAAEVTGLTVIPGQVIARAIEPTPGEPGKDVHGKAVTSPGKPAVLEAGANTHMEEAELLADVYGYLRRAGDMYEVVPPVWVNSESTEAHLIHFPELRRHAAYEPDWLVAALKAAGVTHGVDEDALTRLCADWPGATQADAVLAARSCEPVDGADTHVDFEVDPTIRAGAVREDGSIDYRERNAAVGMSTGQLIGKLVAAVPGTPGADVLGKELPAKDGQDKNITAGANVTAKSEDGTTAFYSDIDGAIQIKGDTIEVQPIYMISGDVDYEVGNIDLPTNVEIGGSVKSEFKVISGGDVTIGGVLEPGCEVRAAGDVVIANGVFGDTTLVVAAGSVETKMIQNSNVRLEGDLTVGSFIYNAVVRAGGTITVEDGGGERAGSICGGEVIAGRQVMAKRIGSEESARTLVGIGPSPEQYQGIVTAEGTLAASQREITRLTDELRIDGTEPQDLKSRQRRCKTDDERKKVDAQVAQLEAALRDSRQATQTRQQLEDAVAAAVAKGTVRGHTIFRDAHLDFGGQVSRVDDTVLEAEFYTADDKVRWRPMA